jgi:hypothetical protein
LKGDEAGQSRAREQLWAFHASLPKYSGAKWSYVGMRNYVRGLSIPVEQKQKLWDALDKIEKN